MRKRIEYCFLTIFPAIYFSFSACGQAIEKNAAWQGLLQRHEEYIKIKNLLQSEFPARRNLPEVKFYLFGMGPRTKLIYKDGALKEALSGKVVRQWKAASEQIMPSEYAVLIGTDDKRSVLIQEDEKGIRIEEDGRIEYLSENPVRLPDFAGKKYAPVLRVLHQELLVNIIHGFPVPNYLVYKKPWYRDGAQVCRCLAMTGNLHLVRDWIMSLSEPCDRNAHHDEPDNLGEALYIISLVSDSSHSLVAKIMEKLPGFKREKYIVGLTDGSDHPVFQTKWLKYGLKCLGLPDPYEIPAMDDYYSSLFWMDYRDKGIRSFHVSSPDSLYPYLGWARAHFFGDKAGCISANLDYPLTWETEASEAEYQGMAPVSERYTGIKTCVPHSWHSAEMFLYLMEF